MPTDHRLRWTAVAASLVLIGTLPAAAAASAVPTSAPTPSLDQVGEASGAIYYVHRDGELSRIDPDRTHRRPISNIVQTMRASLDGRWLAEHWGGKVIIWPRRTPDENGQVIGYADTSSGLGAFSRNGDRFVFAATEEDDDGNLVASDLYLWTRGLEDATLVVATDLVEEQPVWAADQQSVLFVARSDRGCTDPSGNVRWSRDLYRISLADHAIERLTDEPGRTWSIGDSVGRRLLVSSTSLDDDHPEEPCRSGERTMHLVDQADGAVLRDLGRGQPRAVSPDRKHILFRDYERGRLKIRTLASGEEWWITKDDDGLPADWVRSRRDEG